MRSEVRAYHSGISIHIETLSGHKQQEAKQDPNMAEREDGWGKGRLKERVKAWSQWGEGGQHEHHWDGE